MRALPSTVESWSIVVSFMHVTVEMEENEIKENETSRPFKVFHLSKLISLFPDHFQNNNENDQYHVSVDANNSLQSSY